MTLTVSLSAIISLKRQADVPEDGEVYVVLHAAAADERDPACRCLSADCTAAHRPDVCCDLLRPLELNAGQAE